MLSDVPPVGVTVLDQLSKALAQADLVIFVLTTPAANANVYFEIGLALGQGKKLMVIAPEDVADVPADIRELLVVKAQPDNDEAIEYPLDQFLAAPRSHAEAGAASTARIGGRPLGDMADALIRRAESLKSRVAHQPTEADAYLELEQIVSSALQESHVAPIVPSLRQGKRIDFAAWVDELDSLGLNPLLIELKLRLDTAGTINAAVEQAHTYLGSFRARAILIVYLVGPRAEAERLALSPYSILLLDLVDLLNRMRTNSFGAVLRAAIYSGTDTNKV